MMKEKAEELPNGLKGWFDYFDRDGSDEIEINEFVQMIKYLQIEITDRFGIMLFRLFDREDVGCFNYATMRDILYKYMKPYYKKIVRLERERFRQFGLEIKWPERKKPEIIVVEKPGQPIVKIKEVIKEVPVYVDVPVYIEKEVIKEVIVQPKRVEPKPDPKPIVEPKPIVKPVV